VYIGGSEFYAIVMDFETGMKRNDTRILFANKINLTSPDLVLLLAFAQLGKKNARE
jgi:hypothetical protein